MLPKRGIHIQLHQFSLINVAPRQSTAHVAQLDDRQRYVAWVEADLKLIATEVNLSCVYYINGLIGSCESLY